jgi:hypothetical protein
MTPILLEIMTRLMICPYGRIIYYSSCNLQLGKSILDFVTLMAGKMANSLPNPHAHAKAEADSHIFTSGLEHV